MKLIIIFLVTFSSLFAKAQVSDTALLSRIRTEAFTHSRLSDYAYQLIDKNPRLTNSRAYNEAVDKAIMLLKQSGISKAGKESWGEFGNGWQNEQCEVMITKPYRTELISYPVPWTSSYKGPAEARIVLLDADDSAAVNKAGDLKGAVVILNSPDSTFGFPKTPDGSRFADSELVVLKDRHITTPQNWAGLKKYIDMREAFRNYLLQKGAVALLSDDGRGTYGTVSVSAFRGYAKNSAAQLTELVVSAEQYLKIVRTLQHHEAMSIRLNVMNSINNTDLNGYNVIAEITGTDPVLKNEVVMLGAHLDSWTAATGATDNGAGCIAMMEVMRILTAMDAKPKRTIRLCLWGGEEQVLLGSYGYAKKHFGDPLAAQQNNSAKNITAYYNLDNGTGRIRGVWLQGNTQLSSLFTDWMTAMHDPACKTVTPAANGGSDQETFDAYNIPSFQFIQDPMDYERRTHHTNMDTFEHLAFDDLKQAATVISWFVYQTAMKEDKLPGKTNYVAKPFLYDGGFGK